MLRGAFEFQGQKCSAASRAYIPQSLWPDIKAFLIKEMKTFKMGSPDDFSNFMSAVIDKKSFDNITGYIDRAKADPGCEIVTGGGYDGSVGYFIEPTVIKTTDPKFRTMSEEIFGPVYTDVYLDEETLKQFSRPVMKLLNMH